MGKCKISPEIKIKAVRGYLNNKGSIRMIAKKYGVAKSGLARWIAKYIAIGSKAFTAVVQKNNYSADFKVMVVKSYMSGEGSFQDIAIKYNIPNPEPIRDWVLKYNSHKELKSSRIRRTSIMTKGRNTTYEERVEIVKYCIEHQNNYAEASERYQVSYQQAYTWTAKYEKKGVEALLDKRGKRKPEAEISEIEKLKARNKLLEAENRRKQMEIDFLKKLEEIERRRY